MHARTVWHNTETRQRRAPGRATARGETERGPPAGEWPPRAFRYNQLYYPWVIGIHIAFYNSQTNSDTL